VLASSAPVHWPVRQFGKAFVAIGIIKHVVHISERPQYAVLAIFLNGFEVDLRRRGFDWRDFNAQRAGVGIPTDVLLDATSLDPPRSAPIPA
jgi:hypothetical protein